MEAPCGADTNDLRWVCGHSSVEFVSGIQEAMVLNSLPAGRLIVLGISF